jgi:hypothetical protein
MLRGHRSKRFSTCTSSHASPSFSLVQIVAYPLVTPLEIASAGGRKSRRKPGGLKARPSALRAFPPGSRM